MRVFVAVTPGDAIGERLERAVDELRPKSPASKWVRGRDFHVTLAFLGQVDDAKVPAVAEAVALAVASFAPLSLRFKGGGGFGRPRRPRVLWVSVEGDTGALADIQRAIAGALAPLGFPPEDPPFKAHVTLARARDKGGDAGLSACAEVISSLDFGLDFGEARAGEVIVFRSDLSPAGPRYTPVARAPLAGGRGA